MPSPSPVHVGSSAMSCVTRVIANTKTRSKKSSRFVTRCSRSSGGASIGARCSHGAGPPWGLWDDHGVSTYATLESAAFPELTDAQIDVLRPYGTERDVLAGELLFAAGDPTYDLQVVLDGLVRIVAARGTPRERVIAEHGRHRF